jgi:galactokinase
MTGGGFGGCTVNLVHVAAVDKFTRAMKAKYVEANGRDPEVYVCSAADGAERLQ